MDEFWIFGYGSLMWNPGFATHRRMPARLAGYHRSLCVYSHVHRGTAHKPGLVLGLDRGGFCEGVALAARVKDEEEILAYLRGRELVRVIIRPSGPGRAGPRAWSAPVALLWCRQVLPGQTNNPMIRLKNYFRPRPEKLLISILGDF